MLLTAEYLVMSIFPILGLVALADTFPRFSARLAQKVGFKSDSILLIMLTVTFGLLILLSIVISGNDPMFAIKNYGDAELEIATIRIVRQLALANLALIGFFSPIAVGLALKRNRAIWKWLPIAFLGNLGALIWLVRNKSAYQE